MFNRSFVIVPEPETNRSKEEEPGSVKKASPDSVRSAWLFRGTNVGSRTCDCEN